MILGGLYDGRGPVGSGSSGSRPVIPGGHREYERPGKSRLSRLKESGMQWPRFVFLAFCVMVQKMAFQARFLAL